jgi:hypothetical protein
MKQYLLCNKLMNPRSGKKHKKKQQAALDEASSATKNQKKQKVDPSLGWTCHLCRVSVATSARESHEDGKRHYMKLEK